MRPDSHEAYLASVDSAVRPRLVAIQARVEALLPQAQRCIGYSMPAFRTAPGGRIFFYFAAFKKHVGIYPPLRQDVALAEGLAESMAPYRGEKGNLSFAHTQPLPIELIGQVALALHRQDAARGPARR